MNPWGVISEEDAARELIGAKVISASPTRGGNQIQVRIRMGQTKLGSINAGRTGRITRYPGTFKNYKPSPADTKAGEVLMDLYTPLFIRVNKKNGAHPNAAHEAAGVVVDRMLGRADTVQAMHRLYDAAMGAGHRVAVAGQHILVHQHAERVKIKRYIKSNIKYAIRMGMKDRDLKEVFNEALTEELLER